MTELVHIQTLACCQCANNQCTFHGLAMQPSPDIRAAINWQWVEDVACEICTAAFEKHRADLMESFKRTCGSPTVVSVARLKTWRNLWGFIR